MINSNASDSASEVSKHIPGDTSSVYLPHVQKAPVGYESGLGTGDIVLCMELASASLCRVLRKDVPCGNANVPCGLCQLKQA